MDKYDFDYRFVKVRSTHNNKARRGEVGKLTNNHHGKYEQNYPNEEKEGREWQSGLENLLLYYRIM